MNTTLTPTENHIAQTKPWKRKYQAYDFNLDKDRTIYFENPYGKAAKRLYKQYIDYGFEPEMVVPDDLQYYPLSRRFIKKSALEQRGFRITKKTAYKDYIAAFKMANTKNIKAYAGLDLMLRFSDKLLAMLEMHGGIKFNYLLCPKSKIPLKVILYLVVKSTNIFKPVSILKRCFIITRIQSIFKLLEHNYYSCVQHWVYAMSPGPNHILKLCAA